MAFTSIPAAAQTSLVDANGNNISLGQGNVDADTQRVTQGGAPTGTQTSVSSSASDTTILAANSARKPNGGALIYNDSTQILYLLLANATSSTSNYTVQIPSQGYFEVPGGYNGIIKGIWAAANGNARVTELT